MSPSSIWNKTRMCIHELSKTENIFFLSFSTEKEASDFWNWLLMVRLCGSDLSPSEHSIEGTTKFYHKMMWSESRDDRMNPISLFADELMIVIVHFNFDSIFIEYQHMRSGLIRLCTSFRMNNNAISLKFKLWIFSFETKVTMNNSICFAPFSKCTHKSTIFNLARPLYI